MFTDMQKCQVERQRKPMRTANWRVKKKKQAVGTLQVSNEASNRSARQEVVVEEIERMSSTSH